MPLEDGFQLVEVGRFRFVFCNIPCDRDVDIIVEDDHETNFRSEIEYAIESRVLKAGNLAWNLCRHKLFVNCELADTSEDSGENPQHSANVVHGIHVRGVEPGNHGIETGLLFL